jgi:hypothetical protein
MKLVLSLLFLSILFSCDKGAKTPEGLIKMYVNDLTTSTVDKDYFEKYTTGKLWDKVSNLKEEEFSKFVNLSKIKKPRVKISNKNCVADRCTLTYVVKYDVLTDKKKSFESEIKKIAILVKVGESWKISEVSNIKSYFEAAEAIEVLK